MIEDVNYLSTVMGKTVLHTKFYLSMMEFLLNAKQRLVSIGDEFDLTSMQTVTLLLTGAREEPRSMSSFCKLFHCDASNITGIIDGLEQKQLVSRHENPADRRVKVIRLEPAGRKLRQKILERLSSPNESLLNVLSETETKQFTAIIEKLAGNRTV